MPIGYPQIVVDGWIVGIKLNSLFEGLDGLIELTGVFKSYPEVVVGGRVFRVDFNNFPIDCDSLFISFIQKEADCFIEKLFLVLFLHQCWLFGGAAGSFFYFSVILYSSIRFYVEKLSLEIFSLPFQNLKQTRCDSSGNTVPVLWPFWLLHASAEMNTNNCELSFFTHADDRSTIEARQSFILIQDFLFLLADLDHLQAPCQAVLTCFYLWLSFLLRIVTFLQVSTGP